MAHLYIILAANAVLIDMIRSYAAGFIFTTSLPPPVLAGARKAIEILASDEGRELRKKHQDNVKYLRNTLLRNGFPVEHTPSHIIPIKIGNPAQCGMVCDTLLKEKGHYIQAINYPTVARGEEKLRLAPTPHHSVALMDELVSDLKEVWTQLELPFTGLQCEKVNVVDLLIVDVTDEFCCFRNASSVRNQFYSITSKVEHAMCLTP